MLSLEGTGSLEEAFWSQVWRCRHRWPCKKCCWPWRKIDLERNVLVVWGSHPTFSDARLKPLAGMGTHRMAYIFYYQTLLLPRIFLCHQCDFGPCCNPLHLRPGSQSDNGHDKRGKLRNGKNYAPIFLPDGRVWLYSEARRESIKEEHVWRVEYDRQFLGITKDRSWELAHQLAQFERSLLGLPPAPLSVRDSPRR